MPIKIPSGLPAKRILESENIFVMTNERAIRQDIRPLRIALLNIMPKKITTETQIMRLLGNTPLQVEVVLIRTNSYLPKNTPHEHLFNFYKTFDEIKDERYDGLVITGAPVETMEFDEVLYWNELRNIMDWSQTHVTSTFHICWGAQAALHHYYGVDKRHLPQKMFGVFEHHLLKKNVKLLRGFDDAFYVPHSRHTDILMGDLMKIEDLDVLSVSDEAGFYLAASKDGRRIFTTGHSEYDPFTLDEEYRRDLAKGLNIDMPRNYYKNDDPVQGPIATWRAHAHLLYSNWLNYYVYQETPYDLSNMA